jgi:hypothetical protein
MKLRLTIIFSASLIWLISNLDYFLIKMSVGVSLFIGYIGIFCLLTLITTILILIYKIIKLTEWRNFKNYLTILITGLIITSLNIRLLRADENTLQSPVKLKACREEGNNYSILYLRENGTFENFICGSLYYHGTWIQYKDSILLKFVGDKPWWFEGKIIIKDNILFCLHGDTLVDTHYYLGDCK